MILYDNCKMLNVTGEFMCYTDKNKMNWYLKKNLATQIDEKTFKLNFTPKGSGTKLKYYLLPLANHCIVCGSTHNLSKHHVVPYRFRKYMPLEYKSHTSFDILMLCTSCHGTYEKESNKFSKQLYEQYSAQIPYNKNYKNITNIVKILKDEKENIPNARKLELLQKIKTYYNDESITLDTLPQIFTEKNDEEIKKENIQKFITDLGSYFDFIVMWRKHFIDNMDPKFLPEEWKLAMNDIKSINELV